MLLEKVTRNSDVMQEERQKERKVWKLFSLQSRSIGVYEELFQSSRSEREHEQRGELDALS